MAVVERIPPPTPLRRRSDRIVLLNLRRRALRKSRRASRIAVLRLREGGLPHEEIRARMGLGVEEYRAAKRWLNAALEEAERSEGLLTLDEALAAFGERHVDGVVRVGLLKDRGCSEERIREQLGITREQYDIAWDWWRNATADQLREAA